jgi:RNA polymerase-binding transcription factor DksA
MTPEPYKADDALARRAHELEALRQADHANGFMGDQREISGELSTVGQHPADVADITYQRALHQTTQYMLEREAAQVEDALRARASGRYGICLDCSQPIPPERLAARPEATMCVPCQRHREGS